MNSRIKEIRKSLNITQSDFGKQIGLTQSTINEIEHNRCNINDRHIISICSRFNVNEEWLRNGIGEMFNIVDKKYEEFFSIYKQLSPALQDFLYTTACELLKTQDKL